LTTGSKGGTIGRPRVPHPLCVEVRTHVDTALEAKIERWRQRMAAETGEEVPRTAAVRAMLAAAKERS
jgi:hypothetical protein